MSQADKPSVEGLLPCPHCGEKACYDSEHDPDGGGVFYAIRCSKCNARSQQHYVSHGNDCPQFRAEVRASWNRRQSAAAPPIGWGKLSEPKIRTLMQIAHKWAGPDEDDCRSDILEMALREVRVPTQAQPASESDRRAMQRALEALTALRESALHTIAAATGWEASLDSCADEAAVAIAALRSRLDGEKK